MNTFKKSLKKSWLWKILRKLLKPSKGFSSGNYWEQRYKTGDNSGAGSYGRLAKYKAEVLNGFVAQNNLQRVIELGVGDGNQLSLARYPNYIGLDVSATAIAMCKANFEHDHSKEFYLAKNYPIDGPKAELSLSLDVIYHLVEDSVFKTYMTDLFKAASRYVIVYSSNYDEFLATHVRSRKFTSWVEAQQPDWELQIEINNPYPFDPNNPDNTSISNFYVFRKKQA